MTGKRGPVIQWALALLLAFTAFAYLAGSLASLAVNEGLMLSNMERFSDTTASGVDKADYPELAGAITGYLKGKAETAQVEVAGDTGERPAFSEDELQHLQDVRGLLHTAYKLRIAALIVIGVALVCFIVLRKGKPEWLKPVRLDCALMIAACLLLLPVLFVALWALVNFEGAFHAMHRLLFTNELWLLDPQRDLLLQLMPLPFFVSYAWEFLKQNVFLLLALPLAAFGLRAAKKKAEAVAAP